MSANRPGQWTLVPSILHTQIATVKISVLRIHDILVWIRIRRSMPLTNGSGSWILDPDPAIFRHWPSRCQQKTCFLHNFSCLLLFEGTFTLFFKDKGQNQCCGSGSGIWDPGLGPFWPLDPGSGIDLFRIPDLGSRIPNSYFWELSDNFLGKKFHNSLKFGPNFFLSSSKIK